MVSITIDKHKSCQYAPHVHFFRTFFEWFVQNVQKICLTKTESFGFFHSSFGEAKTTTARLRPKKLQAWTHRCWRLASSGNPEGFLDVLSWWFYTFYLDSPGKSECVNTKMCFCWWSFTDCNHLFSPPFRELLLFCPTKSGLSIFPNGGNMLVKNPRDVSRFRPGLRARTDF